MKLERIISLANRQVRLRFLAMERSLRAAGCRLPLWVIPYDDDRFDLPEGAGWWEIPEVIGWLKGAGAVNTMRKYQCLLVGNYQFVDADVVFLRNPEEVLASHTGFVTSCGHWHDPGETSTPESRRIFAKQSKIWQKDVFNSGQFACDRALYGLEELKRVATQPNYAWTCLRFPFHEQPGINLLVHHSGIRVTNLTLPPDCMESTWAGDYTDGYQQFWTDPGRKPYLLHWAGTPMEAQLPIHQLFYDFLTQKEKAEWDEHVRIASRQQRARRRSFRAIARRFKRAFHTLQQV